MARPKPWISRVLDILAALEADTKERYRRTDVEQLFRISADPARELMQLAGAKSQQGVETTVDRRSLLDYVKYSREAQEAIQEQARRAAMAKKLKPSMEEQDLRRIEIPTLRPGAYEWAMLQDLPTSIQIASPSQDAPGRLTIDFRDEVDLLEQLYALAKAVRNDESRFLRAVQAYKASGGPGGKDRAPAPDERKAS